MHETIVPFLWIEVLSFQVAVIVIFCVLAYYFFIGMTISQDRNEDLIICRDVRNVDSTAQGRYRDYPTYHLFTQDMAEIGFT